MSIFEWQALIVKTAFKFLTKLDQGLVGLHIDNATFYVQALFKYMKIQDYDGLNHILIYLTD